MMFFLNFSLLLQYLIHMGQESGNIYDDNTMNEKQDVLRNENKQKRQILEE